MFGAAVSRWTMMHFGAALTFFILAQLAMVAGAAYPALPLAAPPTLSAVHALTVGWLTLLILGALHQFVPVITAQARVADLPALISFMAILAGLGGMEAGFLALSGVLPVIAMLALPAGGVLVLTGIAIAVASLGITLWRGRPLPFPVRFVAVGIAFLLVTVGLGILMGLTFAEPELVSWSGVFTAGLRLHIGAGLIGWFTLTAMGVSYRLLSMFMLAPEERGARGDAVLILNAGGLAATWLLGAAAAIGAAVPEAEIAAAGAATGAGIALYLFDMALLYRARRRQVLELNTGMAIPALAALGLGLLLALAAAAIGAEDRIIGPLGYVLLFGWLSGLGLSQLYKIVPFLTWLERYGSLLGKQPVPRVQDLVDERRDRPWFLLYFLAVAAGTLFGVLGWVLPWRLAILGHLVATLMIARALWLARHGALRNTRPVTPASGMSSLATPVTTTE